MSKINIQQPKRNEIRRGEDAGYKRCKGKYIWHACEICGKERWVEIRKRRPISTRCLLCARKLQAIHMTGANHPAWKGGRFNSEGYAYIRLYPDDFFYSMVIHNGYVLEHRYVMAKYLSRHLNSWEVVHHKNGIRDDNRLENLELIPAAYKHNAMTRMANYIKKLEEKIKILEMYNNVSH